MLSDNMRFSTYRLCEFEEMGGTWETVEISKRTDEYTDRLCKLQLEGKEGYTHIRFYKNGLAMIGVPFYNKETNQIYDNMTSDITNKMKEILYDYDRVKKLNPFIQKRINQQALYDITTVLTWLVIIAMIFITLFKVISIIECTIGIILLTTHLLAKKKVWYPKIRLIGSTERNYYENYK